MKRVLVVDDEENTRVGLVKLLSQDGHQVEAVADGVEALNHLANEKVDLVITDINMPGMNGLVFLHELQSFYPEIQVIMITAYGGVGSYLEAMNLGVLEYLYKPVKVNELRAIIGHIFNPTSSIGGTEAAL